MSKGLYVQSARLGVGLDHGSWILGFGGGLPVQYDFFLDQVKLNVFAHLILKNNIHFVLKRQVICLTNLKTSRILASRQKI